MKTIRSTHIHGVIGWVKEHRKNVLIAVGLLVLVNILFQLFYPSDRMPLFATVDGVNVSGWLKKDAIKKLDSLTNKQTLTVVLGDTKQTNENVSLSKLGIKVSNSSRITAATYPWYVRVVPTSSLWFGPVQSESLPKYAINKTIATKYITSTFGDTCIVAPKDATLKVSSNELSVVQSKLGGTCEINQAVKSIESAKPVITKKATITIPVKATQPAVANSTAQKLADKLNKTSSKGVVLKVVDKQQAIAQKEVLSWLDFAPSGKELSFSINATRANVYLAKTATPIISKPAGVTKVSTLDFTETSRSDGATGQTLDVTATLKGITDVLDGETESATAVATRLAPTVQYTRSYTKTSIGIAAQIKFYDDDNTGKFGVSFIELGGQGLSAQHNGGQQFVTASTYKLFVAFSTLRRVDAGQMAWSDANIAGSRNLGTCFDDMIVKSDNACAEALIKKIGASGLNADIKSIGLNNTAFRADNNLTTPNDLATYLTKLEKGELPIKPESRTRLLDAMKRNVYRTGIPTGSSGPTADKVGFLWGLLHDAAIVYSPKGTYVLVVMSDGSSWGAIADLTRKIEALR